MNLQQRPTTRRPQAQATRPQKALLTICVRTSRGDKRCARAPAHARAAPGSRDACDASRTQKAEADLIVANRGPVMSVLFGFGGFLRSRYFANVRKSIGVFIGMWLWYVLNTKTYMPPEIEE